MTLRLDTDRSGDIEVLHGIDSTAALAHVIRSVASGAAFDDNRALVVDLRDRELLTADLACELSEAAGAAEHRQHRFVVVSGACDLGSAVREIRQWFDLVDGHRAANSAPVIARAVVGLLARVTQWSIRAARAAISR